jgi:hypothetical protein
MFNESSFMTYLSTYNPFNGPSDSKFKNFLNKTSKPVSAGAAIALTVQGFIAKSARQAGDTIPKITLKKVKAKTPTISITQLAVEGVKASPKIAGAVGAQMAVQEKCKEYIDSTFFKNSQKKGGFLSTLLSSLPSAIVASPFLIAFNDQTITGNTFIKSLKTITPAKIGVTIGRETGFVTSMGFSGPLAKEMKTYSDTKITEKIAYFISGYLGSFAGHSGDTALSFLQKGIKFPAFRPLNRNILVNAVSIMYRGGSTKAKATGIFSVIYNSLNNFIEQKTKK